ncbi:deoxyribose-phosphate aldolase [candidate division WOR-3 bacterium]|nr:deoxyribose-phosphate aldolase [candidate division WOR-3 bacterium]
MKLNKYIDHTLLKPDATNEQIMILINEAIEFNFFSVCVNPCFIDLAKKALIKTNVKVATVIGFPLGTNTTESKINEARDAIKRNADELDMVINIGMLKQGNIDYIINEINSIKNIAGKRILKVIVETCLLSNDEKKAALEAVIKGNADFIKTSTGFSTGGADINDIKLFKELAAGKIKIKASGGIRTREKAIRMIEAGADRLGTSSSVAIVKGE